MSENVNRSVATEREGDLSAQLLEAIAARDALSESLAAAKKERDFANMELARHYSHHPQIQADLLSLLGMLRPMKAIGFDKVRLGGHRDGGYVVLDDFIGVQAAYSIGIADDVTWDRHLAQRGVQIYQYDHTIDAPPEHHHRFHWRKLGLGTRDDPAASILGLGGMLTQNGHSNARDLVLKIDIEDAEWDVFGVLDPAILNQFRQIVGEFHRFHNVATPARCERMRKAVAALTANHRLVHVHGNNFGPYLIMGGVPIPDSLELTFVREDDKIFEPSQETFPTQLDRPNDPRKADYCLGMFRF